MEWVEVTGKTVDEAKESALEQLGVVEADAEILIVAEPKAGLFGRVRGEARVRARVRPAGPRPKRNRSSRDRSERPADEASSEPAAQREPKPQAQKAAKPKNDRPKAEPKSPRAGGSNRPVQEDGEMAEGMTLEEQAEVGNKFLMGLVEAFGYEATVEIRNLDDETVELAVNGEELGLLVGPRGSTLAALQDLTRTVVQSNFSARTDRILVDVAQYRERRVAALQRWVAGIAEEVKASGEERALEPMSPADRKVIHDAINDIEGLATRSEGEDARRYVVIEPAN